MSVNETVHEINTQEVTQTWNKLSNSAKKAGFRDGASHGKESVFQTSFDEGYSQGFKSGFARGKLKGLVRVESNQENLPEDVDAKATETRIEDHCPLCTNNSSKDTQQTNIIEQHMPPT